MIVNINRGLDHLTDQERLFIELVAEMPYNQEITVQNVLDEVGIARATYYKWKDKHATLIGKHTTTNMSKIRPKILEVVVEMINSTKASDRKAATEMFLKLDAKIEKEQDIADYDKLVHSMSKGIEVLIRALNITDINDATDFRVFVDLISESVVETIIRRDPANDQWKNLSISQTREAVLHELRAL